MIDHTPLGAHLQTMHQTAIDNARNQDELHRAIKRAYWINRNYPVSELCAHIHAENEHDLVTWIGPAVFEHLCPRCNRQTNFTMTRRGYRKPEHLCPTCAERYANGCP